MNRRSPADRVAAFLLSAAAAALGARDAIAQKSGCFPDWQDTGGTLAVESIVNDFALFGGVLVVGGDIQQVGSIGAKNVAAWNGFQWAPLGSNLKGSVNALAVFQGTLYAGGSFDWTPPGGGAGDPGGGPDPGWQPLATGSVLASWNPTTGAWQAEGHDPTAPDQGRAFELAVHAGALYVGGNIGHVPGVPGGGFLLRWSPGWSVPAGGIYETGTPTESGGVYALREWDPDGAGILPLSLFVGGQFERVHNVAGDAGVAGTYALARYEVGLDQFFSVGGGITPPLDGALDPGSGGVDPHGAALAHSVQAFEVFRSGTERLYVGGAFERVGGGLASPARNIASWAPATGFAGVGGGILGDYVRALRAVSKPGCPPLLYAGGNFSKAGHVASTSIARWDGAAWHAVGGGIWVGPSGHSVHAITEFQHQVHVGGLFDGVVAFPLFAAFPTVIPAWSLARLAP